MILTDMVSLAFTYCPNMRSQFHSTTPNADCYTTPPIFYFRKDPDRPLMPTRASNRAEGPEKGKGQKVARMPGEDFSPVTRFRKCD